MMEDTIMLDQLGTLPKFNCISLCENNRSDDDDDDDDDDDEEINDSPFTVINNSCDYYQSSDVKNMLIHDKNSLSLFCLNCHGLKADWESLCNLLGDMHGELYEQSFDIIGIT